MDDRRPETIRDWLVAADMDMDAPTARERFCTALAYGPLLPSDAVVLFAGQDGEARMKVAAQAFIGGGAPLIVVTGGADAPPAVLGADSLAKALKGFGIAEGRVIIDYSENTREQAVALAALAQHFEWGQVLLVASAYHMPRAFLTVVRALTKAGIEEKVRVLPMPVSHTPWFKPPPGMETPRIALLQEEFAKVERYREHVATYEEGLRYLEHWEGR